MAISDDLILQAIDTLSSVEGVSMDPDALAEDAFLLGEAFPEEREYLASVLATQRALELLVAGRVNSAKLAWNQAGWNSYHYQHRVGQGAKADCRVEWQKRDGTVYVRGFGHRWMPDDFYTRMSATRTVGDA